MASAAQDGLPVRSDRQLRDRPGAYRRGDRGTGGGHRHQGVGRGLRALLRRIPRAHRGGDRVRPRAGAGRRGSLRHRDGPSQDGPRDQGIPLCQDRAGRGALRHQGQGAGGARLRAPRGALSRGDPTGALARVDGVRRGNGGGRRCGRRGDPHDQDQGGALGGVRREDRSRGPTHRGRRRRHRRGRESGMAHAEVRRVHPPTDAGGADPLCGTACRGSRPDGADREGRGRPDHGRRERLDTAGRARDHRAGRRGHDLALHHQAGGLVQREEGGRRCRGRGAPDQRERLP